MLMELMNGLRGVFILCSLECDSADGTHDGLRGVFILCSLECDSADGTHDGPQRRCSSYVLWNVIVLMEL